MADSPTNLLIYELQKMSPVAFADWAEKFRKEIVFAWDELGVPFLGGQGIDQIVRQFKALITYDVSPFSRTDELTGQKDCIVNETAVGSACNQFFPTMLKTKDISSSKLEGLSIYSYFSDENLKEDFAKVVKRMMDTDPFGYFSKALSTKEGVCGSTWLQNFNTEEGQSFWISSVKTERNGLVYLKRDEVDALLLDGCIADHQIKGDADTYCIRIFDPDARIMDSAGMFRLCFGGTPATNFPPLTAKYLYLRFTEDIQDQEQVVVYDPSSGWGGRILGAMACCNDRPIHYVGTDPNSDHWMGDLGITKYEYLADYFNGNVAAKRKNTYEIFRVGSETIHDEPEFQKYKGEVDFVFTSPPYFAAEGYNDEPTQSHVKFSNYDEWRDGFLQKTLETCVEWLKEGRWLCLNIADVRVGNSVIPLQRDATEILLSLGMGYHGVLKMVLRDAPLGSKETDSGIPTTRNFCQIGGKRRKFEPILLFKKFIEEWD